MKWKVLPFLVKGHSFYKLGIVIVTKGVNIHAKGITFIDKGIALRIPYY